MFTMWNDAGVSRSNHGLHSNNGTSLFRAASTLLGVSTSYSKIGTAMLFYAVSVPQQNACWASFSSQKWDGWAMRRPR